MRPPSGSRWRPRHERSGRLERRRHVSQASEPRRTEGPLSVDPPLELDVPEVLVRRAVEWYHSPPGIPPFTGDPSEAVEAALESILDGEETGTAQLDDAVAAFERERIAQVLRDADGRIRRAAGALGIPYSTAKKKVREHGLRRRRRFG